MEGGEEKEKKKQQWWRVFVKSRTLQCFMMAARGESTPLDGSGGITMWVDAFICSSFRYIAHKNSSQSQIEQEGYRHRSRKKKKTRHVNQSLPNKTKKVLWHLPKQ